MNTVTDLPPSMSIDQFINELRGLRSRFHWSVHYSAWTKPGFGIIRCVTDDPDMGHCPITGMTLALFGIYHRMSDYQRARVPLGLSEDDALLIAEAADSPTTHSTELLDLHNRMLEALGL